MIDPRMVAADLAVLLVILLISHYFSGRGPNICIAHVLTFGGTCP